MSSHGQTYEAFAQIPGKGWELWWLWSDVNQRILRELVTFSTGAAKEGIRLSAEIQLAAVEAVKDGQTFLLQRQAELPDAPKDPVGWYQRSVLESVDGMQKALKLVEGTTQAVTRSAERVRTTAEQAAKEIQASFMHLADEAKSAGAPTAQPPSARGQKVQA